MESASAAECNLGRCTSCRRWRCLVALVVLLLSIPPSDASPARRRRRLNSDESILEHLQHEHDIGVSHPQFTIVAESPSTDEEVELDVVEATLSVTAATTYSIEGGPSMPVGELGVKVLVADPSGGGGGGAQQGLTMIVVDEITGRVEGVSQVEGSGKPMSISQLSPDDAITLTDTPDFEPPEWSCGVTGSFMEETSMPHAADDHDVPPASTGDSSTPSAGMKPLAQVFVEDPGMIPLAAPLSHNDAFVVQEVEWNPPRHRDLEDDRDHVHHHSGSGQHHHHHEHHHTHQHVHSRDLNGDFFQTMMSSLGDELRDTQPIHTNQHRNYPTEDFPKRWSQEVQLYIEIDREFVEISGGGNVTVAIQYVGVLVSAVSALFEKEIDTHLQVQHVALTNLYDEFERGDLSPAISKMRATYGNAAAWHYQDKEIDLHHAMLGGLGGGVAYWRDPDAVGTVGTICNSLWGFAISAGMRGTFESIDARTVWDYLVVAHEIGHNFGTLHTHDSYQYDPLVDQCGVPAPQPDPNPPTLQCDARLPLEGSATIMGYCHACRGGLSNVAYTFGGAWDEGDRSDVSNWYNSDLAGMVSTQPRRVPLIMWSTIKSRGQCVAPGPDVPSFVCTEDDDCNDGIICTEDTCNNGRCKNIFKEVCCGNQICELGEVGTCSYGDCGPFTIEAISAPGQRWVPNGFMFDISTMTSISVNGLVFRVHSGDQSQTEVNGDIIIFTTSGSFHDNFDHPSRWSEVSRQSISASNWAWISLEFEEINVISNATQALYIHMSGGSRVVAGQNSTNPVASNEHLSIHTPGRYIIGDALFGGGTSSPNGISISWEGNITYDLRPLCSQDSDCDDGNSCTVDTCEEGTCTNLFENSCCGNDVCEASDGESCSSDCGPWDLDYDYCENYADGRCYYSRGMMFDISASPESGGVSVSAISLRLDVGTNIKIDFYIRRGLGVFDTYEYDPLAWRHLATSDTYNVEEPRTLVSFPIPPVEIDAASTRAFYVVATHDGDESEGGILCGFTPSPKVSDDNIEIHSPATVFPDSEPFGEINYPQYSFQGGITYSAIAIPEPTGLPSSAPTYLPTISTAPTLFPSTSLVPTQTMVPSTSNRPSISYPPSTSAKPSGKPSISAHPSVRKSSIPSVSMAPTYTPSESPTGILWYMNWSILLCQQDCVGDPPCGGKAQGWMLLHPTAADCCHDAFWFHSLYDEQCLDLSLEAVSDP